MGVLCDIASRHAAHVIADFVCPTPEARAAFGPAYIVWVDRIKEGRFEDTNKLFVQPEHYDFRIHCALNYEFHILENIFGQGESSIVRLIWLVEKRFSLDWSCHRLFCGLETFR
jgi:hypothetical protein